VPCGLQQTHLATSPPSLQDQRVAGAAQPVGSPKEAWTSSSSSGASPTHGDEGGSPTRLLVGVSHGGSGGPAAFANPVHPSNLAAAAAAPAAPVPTDAAGVPVRNPFNG
jgi:hypothetical protein